MAEKSCWDIMGCDKSDLCIAKHQPQKPCWEHAHNLAAVPEYFSLCADCIVFAALKKDSTIDLEGILHARQQRDDVHIFRRCPLISHREVFAERLKDRREAQRFSCKSPFHVSLKDENKSCADCCLIDLSKSGVAFTCDERTLPHHTKTFLDLALPGVASVREIPVRIVSGHSSAAPKGVRYGAHFYNLSDNQRTRLYDLVALCAAA